uniref:Phage protein n=1 Tax=Geladintestivirus 2 TaxID=3233134 RepID=A0AAU8MK47_9CAUD
MSKYKFIHVDVFKKEIGLFVGTREDFISWIDEEYGNCDSYKDMVECVHNHPIRYEDGTFWYNEKTGDGVIELHDIPHTAREIAIASHEALHATFQILDTVGVDYNKDTTNEAYCYLLELIMRNILKINNYKTYKRL